MIDSSVETSPQDTLKELCSRVATLERLVDRIPHLERELALLREPSARPREVTKAGPTAAPAGAATQILERVWLAAPLVVRLEFLRSQLEPGDSLVSVLQETIRLLELLDREQELQGWMRDYPSLFAEAYAAISGPFPQPVDDLRELSHRTVGESHHKLDAHLRRLGVEWIEPAPGDAVTDAHSIVEESAVPGILSGRVSSCRRAGFRWNGELRLPALVARQPSGASVLPAGTRPNPEEARIDPMPSHGAEIERVATTHEPQRVEPEAAVTAAPAPDHHPQPEQPQWLVGLQRSIPDGDRTTAGALTRGLAELVNHLSSGNRNLPDYEITVALKPLLSLLGSTAGAWRPDLPRPWTEAFQRGRPELLGWLSDHLSLEIFVPTVGEAFSLEAMQTTAERRTAHPHEWGTVARVEAPGLLRAGQVLLPARVVRYESGGGD